MPLLTWCCERCPIDGGQGQSSNDKHRYPVFLHYCSAVESDAIGHPRRSGPFYNRTLSYFCQRGLQTPRNFAVRPTYTLVSGSQPPMTCVVAWRAPGNVADMLPKNIQASCMHEWNFCCQILVKRQETEFPIVQQKRGSIHRYIVQSKRKKLSPWQWCLSYQMH